MNRIVRALFPHVTSPADLFLSCSLLLGSSNSQPALVKPQAQPGSFSILDYDQGGYTGGSGGMNHLRSGPSLHANGQMNRAEFGAPSGQFSMMGDVPLRASSTSPYAPPFGSGSVMDRRTPSPMQAPAGGYMIPSSMHSPSMANNYPRAPMQGSPYPPTHHHRSPSDGFLSSNVVGPSHPNDARMAYLHEESPEYGGYPTGAGGAQICRYFLTGNCMRGDRCNFLHTRTESHRKEDKKRDKNKNRFPNTSSQSSKFNGRRGRGVGTPIPEPGKSRPAVDGM